MPKNVFIALLSALGAGIAAGLAILLLTSLLFSGLFHRAEDDFFSPQSITMIISCVISVIAPPVFCVGFLLPLAAVDKERIERFERKQLMTRYTPILAIPFGILFLFILTNSMQSANDRYSLFTVFLTLYAIAFSALWFFVKKLKT